MRLQDARRVRAPPSRSAPPVALRALISFLVSNRPFLLCIAVSSPTASLASDHPRYSAQHGRSPYPLLTGPATSRRTELHRFQCLSAAGGALGELIRGKPTSRAT